MLIFFNALFIFTNSHFLQYTKIILTKEVKSLKKIAKKPYFIEKIDQKYGAGAGNIFLLHGNIHDIFSRSGGHWKPLLNLLTEEFSRENRIFIQIDLAEGFSVLPIWPSSPGDLSEKEQSEL